MVPFVTVSRYCTNSGLVSSGWVLYIRTTIHVKLNLKHKITRAHEPLLFLSSIRRVVLSLCCLMVMFPAAFSQKQYNNFYFSWYMGLRIDGCGETVLNDGQMNGVTSGGAATISDASGNLLFYSNSMSVWNRNHQIMPNGSFTTFWNGITSHYQGPVFVPYPGNSNIYYLFHESRTQVWNNDGDFVVELHYSIIDRTLDGGRGDISVKDQFLCANVTEATAAVTDASGNGYWVVTHMTKNDSFVVYHVGPAGLDPHPTYYKVGPAFGNTWRDRQVVIKFTPDRTKMVITRNIPSVRPNDDRDGGFDLYQFDDATGNISNPIVIRDGFVTEVPNSLGRYFSTGAEFSPDSRLLYVSSWDKLFQFDVSNYNYNAVNNSETLVGTSDFYSYGLAQVLLAPNGKIYLTKWYPDQYLGEIKNPNVQGTGCGFKTDAVFFPKAVVYASLSEGLGNCIQPYVQATPYTPADMSVTKSCYGDSTVFSIPMANVDSVKWDFGDPASNTADTTSVELPKHYFANQQDYTVQSTIYSSCAQVTIQKTVTISDPKIDIGDDTVLCTGQPLTLRANLPGASFSWQDGSLLDTIPVHSAGQYKVIADYKGCSVSDSLVVNYLPLPANRLGGNTSICAGDSVLLSDPDPGLKFQWQDASTGSALLVKQAGIYWLKATDNNGCSSADTVVVSSIPLPVFSLGADTTLCDGRQLHYDLNASGVNYNWNDGTLGGRYVISQPGLYWLNAEKDGCGFRDSIQVSYKPNPVVSLGPDTLMCIGDSKLLKVSPPYSSVLWSNGSHGDELNVKVPGLYWVSVNLQGCITSDSVAISYHTVPEFSLGADTVICTGTTVLLAPSLKNSDLRWQDNSTGGSYLVTEPGTYALTASNVCGSSASEIHITPGACILVIPNAFTPNSDGHNDLFRVKYPQFIQTFRMSIFDRWGRRVFETADARQGWDGNSNGQAQPAGTYVWMIYYHDVLGNNVNRSGTLLLIR